MNNKLNTSLNEISKHLQNKDLNRTGIRLLDLVFDFNFPKEIQDMVLALRIRYNNEKELGKSLVSNDDLYTDYSAIIDKISTISCEPITSKVEIICTAEAITKTFKTSTKNFILEPIDVSLTQGQIIGVVGENGNGKTTLLRMLVGDLSINSGEINYFYNNGLIQDWNEIKQKIVFIPQRIPRWHGNVYENISFLAASKGIKGDDNQEKVEFIIHRFGLTKFKYHTWSQLSSGYKLRVEIAKALVWCPSLLILDEPLANLDIQAQELMLEDLRNIANSLRNPTAIILSSQQLHEVEKVSDTLIFLKNGRAIFNGKLSEISLADESNIFELSGDCNSEKLLKMLNNWEHIKVEESLSSLLVTVPKQYSSVDFLKVLADNQIEVTYFRNISNSTKKLFNDKY